MPEIEIALHKKEKLMKKALIIGTVVPFIIYLIFTFVMVGVYGKVVNEISTISLGRLIVILGIVTMATSYFALSIALRDMYRLDYKKSKRKAWVYTCIVPLLIFLIFNLIKFNCKLCLLSLDN
ncbi:MAG: hypothetical protein AABY22_16440, partial [Nanoarchaeota archaeon]